MTRPAPRMAILGTGMLLTLALGALGAAPASADVEDFEFSSVEVDYYLSANSEGRANLGVVETWVAEFPETDQNRGIVRALPRTDGYTSLRTLVESVTDENGDAVPYDTDVDGDEVTLEIDDDEYKHGEHIYVISYTMINVMRATETGDEFFPDVNGTGWEQPIGSVTGRLHVTGEIAAALDGRTACYTGDRGSTDSDCTVSESTGSTADWPPIIARDLDLDEVDGELVVAEDEPTTIITAESGRLEPEQNLSFVVGFAAGTFVQPPEPPLVAILPWVAGGILLLSLLHVLLALVVRARDNARLPRPRIVQYTPPRGVPIRVSATVIGRRQKLLAAATIDLVVRRLASVSVDKDTSKADGLRPLAAAGAGGDDEPLLRAMFGKKRASVRFDAPSEKRAKNLLKYRAESTQAAIDSGHVRAERRWTGVISIVVGIIVVAAIVLLFIFTAAHFLAGWITVVTAVVSIALFVLAIVVRPRDVSLTREGEALAQYLAGMREYIDLAEADRLRFLQAPDTAEVRRAIGSVEPADADGDAVDELYTLHVYEKLLPYAVLFGLEKKWAQVLDALSAELPETADSLGAGVYQAIALGSLSSSIRTLGSSPASYGGNDGSSSGSGFSSGGFSGGGFGGGGGGGR